MPRQEGSIGSNGNDDQTNYHHQPGGEDARLINDIAWEIGSFVFHIYSWFEHIEIELLLMNVKITWNSSRTWPSAFKVTKIEAEM